MALGKRILSFLSGLFRELILDSNNPY